MTCAICEGEGGGGLLYEMPLSLCVCVSVCEYVYLYVSVCECVLGVHTVRNPPANEKALCRVQPYCILRAGPFVRVYRTTKRRHH